MEIRSGEYTQPSTTRWFVLQNRQHGETRCGQAVASRSEGKERWSYLQVADGSIEGIIAEATFLVQEFPGFSIHGRAEQAVIEALLQLLKTSTPATGLIENPFRRVRARPATPVFYSTHYYFHATRNRVEDSVEGWQLNASSNRNRNHTLARLQKVSLLYQSIDSLRRGNLDASLTRA